MMRATGQPLGIPAVGDIYFDDIPSPGIVLLSESTRTGHPLGRSLCIQEGWAFLSPYVPPNATSAAEITNTH